MTWLCGATANARPARRHWIAPIRKGRNAQSGNWLTNDSVPKVGPSGSSEPYGQTEGWLLSGADSWHVTTNTCFPMMTRWTTLACV